MRKLKVILEGDFADSLEKWDEHRDKCTRFVETKALLSVDDIHVGYICADICLVKIQQNLLV